MLLIAANDLISTLFMLQSILRNTINHLRHCNPMARGGFGASEPRTDPPGRDRERPLSMITPQPGRRKYDVRKDEGRKDKAWRETG